MLNDSDAIVRFEALKAAASQGGKVFSDADAKAILVRPPPGLSYGDPAGEGCYEEFIEERLRKLPKETLAELVAKASVYEITPYLAFVHADFDAYGDGLRHAIADQFKQFFDDAVERFSAFMRSESDLIARLKSSGETVRKEFTRKGLDVISKRAESRDLQLVRRSLQSGFIPYSDSDLDFLRKFGEWDDIAMITELINKPYLGASLIGSGVDTATLERASRVIYHLGRERLSELVSLPLKYNELSIWLFHEIPMSAFRTLDDAVVMQLFESEWDRFRKAVALKCVKCLPRARLRRLLDRYTRPLEANRYYNVIHWLDLGCSMPSSIATRAASIELERLV
jgi:hypothetical protein